MCPGTNISCPITNENNINRKGDSSKLCDRYKVKDFQPRNDGTLKTEDMLLVNKLIIDHKDSRPFISNSPPQRVSMHV